MWRRPKQYLRENWGAPFVVAFILLLTTSAIFLSIGESDTANSVAVYAFYSLVIGVVLQIASYVKYGEGEKQLSESSLPRTVSHSTNWRLSKKSLAVALIVIIIIATTLGVLYLGAQQKQVTTGPTTQAKIGQFSIGIGFIKELPELNDAFQILVGINQTGGIQPFNFTAYWSDGVDQSNSIGVFTRSFLSNQTIPSTIRIIANSSDGQSSSTMVTIPEVTRTVTTSSISAVSTSTLPQIVFVESGLPSGSLWSVSLKGMSFHSNSTELAFGYPLGNIFNFTISGPYDQRSFKWAFVPTTSSGTVVVTGSLRIDVDFSNQSISSPVTRIFLVTGSPTAVVTGPTTEEIRVTFLNTFPVQIQGIVLATVRNNSTGSVTIQTATIEPQTNSNQTALLLFGGLSSGNYSGSVVVQSATGVQLSTVVNFTFAVRN